MRLKHYVTNVDKIADICYRKIENNTPHHLDAGYQSEL